MQMPNAFIVVPAIRLFHKYKIMNPNTVAASSEPTMKCHGTLVLAEKKILSYYVSTKNEGPKAKQVCSGLMFCFIQDCLQLKTKTLLKKKEKKELLPSQVASIFVLQQPPPLY